MRFEVDLSPACTADLDDVYAWIAAGSRMAAERWIEEIHADLETLAVFPKRCPLAPEAAGSGLEFRQLLCGDYRILFLVKGHQVRVERVRHAARMPLTEEP